MIYSFEMEHNFPSSKTGSRYIRREIEAEDDEQAFQKASLLEPEMVKETLGWEIGHRILFQGDRFVKEW